MGRYHGDDDIIRRFLRVVVDEIPGAPTNAVQRIEHRIRYEWGGSRPYIAKRIGEMTLEPRAVRRWMRGR